MGDWNDIFEEVNRTPSKSNFDHVCHKYVKALSELTKRNTIIYYSSWLSKPSAANTDINDGDMEGFLNCVHGMDCSKGLDLVLHTPGGSPNAAEGIVDYLKSKFKNDIRVIVPHMCMSAGTMIACASKEIIMGRQSCLGSIDPQFSGIPAYNIMSEFEEAKADLAAHPENAQYWAIKLQQYPAAFMKSAMDAMELSSELAKKWLGDVMFDSKKDKKKIEKIVERLNEHKRTKAHSRHLNIQLCRDIGLNVYAMEDDDELQDAILSVHHAFMVTMNATPVVKVIENQNGKKFVMIANQGRRA